MQRSLQKIFAILSLLFILNTATTLAEVKSPEASSFTIKNFEILEDVDGQYDFSTVSSPDFDEAFHQHVQENISLGISPSVFWVRFIPPAENYFDESDPLLLNFTNPSINKLDVYIPVKDSTIAKGRNYILKQAGAERPGTAREIWDADWTFSLPHQYIQGKYIYLRLQSVSVMNLPVMIWQEKDFIHAALLKNIAYGLFYGILLSMVFYNLFIVFVLKDRTYLFYVLYIAFMLIYQFNSHGHLRLWLDIDYRLYNALFWFCLSAAFSFAALFSAKFLQIHSDEIFLKRIFNLILLLSILIGILGIPGCSIPANWLSHGLGLIQPLVFIGLAFYRFRNGFRPAIYYLLAWGILSCGILGWIFLPDRTTSSNVLMLATALESILLSLALSARFRDLRITQLTLTRNLHYYRDLSLTDALTGLYNRRCLNSKMQKEISQALTEGISLSLMIMDIDFFKKYNDAYGHWQGDQVLVGFSNVLLKNLNDTQLAFRFGGEEFVILLPNLDAVETSKIAENIRRDFAAKTFRPTNKKTVQVTVSIGISTLTAQDNEAALFERTDKALYEAKTAGRNRVVIR
ncbi:diguanylate cyclase (GGDEF) domain-containing protein [Propionispira arboris]|uniref:Diguanylate cyclase (GGDEF) domain-containing protein n=1 Tax=Propionispira arboris TaxID=84035 RepID=A0A1H6V9Y2_9FIRM|nr:diguanylate cyclase (GGDEF) domain-containing protein [Propionispira arboris]